MSGISSAQCAFQRRIFLPFLPYKKWRAELIRGKWNLDSTAGTKCPPGWHSPLEVCGPGRSSWSHKSASVLVSSQITRALRAPEIITSSSPKVTSQTTTKDKKSCFDFEPFFWRNFSIIHDPNLLNVLPWFELHYVLFSFFFSAQLLEVSNEMSSFSPDYIQETFVLDFLTGLDFWLIDLIVDDRFETRLSVICRTQTMNEIKSEDDNTKETIEKDNNNILKMILFYQNEWRNSHETLWFILRGHELDARMSALLIGNDSCH